MSTINDGGPAFARSYGGHPDPALGDPEMQSQEGMTLRDYFAAKALTGLIANSEAANGGVEPMVSYLSRAEDGPAWLAGMAYRLADAMLEARK